MEKSIIVVGSINTDLILQCEHLPVPGETILSGDMQTAGGGKGANQAVAAARLEASTAMVGMVGMDAYGNQHIASFKRDGLNTKFVFRTPDAPSGTAIILLDKIGQNSIVVSPGANARLSEKEIAEASELFIPGNILVMQMEIPMETVIFSARLAKQRGMPVILNPAPAQSLPEALMGNIDYLIVNETEMEIISGCSMENEDEALLYTRKWIEKGIRGVVLTLGSKGAWFVSGEEEFFMPPYEVEAVDTTAAGDAFVGAFAKALSEDQNYRDAMQFAAATGALAVTKLGAQPSLPNLNEVAAFLAR